MRAGGAPPVFPALRALANCGPAKLRQEPGEGC